MGRSVPSMMNSKPGQATMLLKADFYGRAIVFHIPMPGSGPVSDGGSNPMLVLVPYQRNNPALLEPDRT